MIIDAAYLNYRSGGLVDGKYEFDSLRQAVTPLVGRAPAVFAFCEGKKWLHKGGIGMNAACAALDDVLGRPYVGQPGWHRRGEYGPAIVWDPQVLRLISWSGADHDSNALHDRNIAEFAVRSAPSKRLRMKVVHYPFDSGTERMAEAEQDANFAGGDVPFALVGDLNSTASGAFLPQRNWEEVPLHKRRHKARLVDGVWVADTRALDILIGEHDGAVVDDEHRVITRVGGAGFESLAEFTFCTSKLPGEQVFRPTINSNVDKGGSLIIDWWLANPALSALYVPDSHEVHVPEGQYPSTWPLDHRMVSVQFDL